jgi:hypothetical protein
VPFFLRIAGYRTLHAFVQAQMRVDIVIDAVEASVQVMPTLALSLVLWWGVFVMAVRWLWLLCAGCGCDGGGGDLWG